MSERQYDIAVVGAGVVGAVAALLLADAGYDVAIIEPRAPKPITGRLGVDPRTLAISPGSQRLIEQVGAWPAVATSAAQGAGYSQPYLHMCVWDGDGGGELRFTVDDLHPMPSALGYIVEQSSLTMALWRALLAHPRVSVFEGHAVRGLNAHPTSSSLQRVQLDADAFVDTHIVIAADGAASPTRTLAGGSIKRTDTGQIAIATIVAHESAHEATAWQVFRATGPLAFLPLTDGELAGKRVHRSSIVWSCDAEYGETVLQLDDAAFLAALSSAFGDRLGAVTHVDVRARIALTQQQATHYQPRSGVLLVGDAAHVVHPLAGQGVNLGLRDVRILTEVLGRAEASPSARAALLTNARLLAQYELRARTVNDMALGFMAGIQRLFASDHPLLRSLRSGGMTSVDRFDSLRRQLAREAMGQGLLARV